MELCSWTEWSLWFKLSKRILSLCYIFSPEPTLICRKWLLLWEWSDKLIPYQSLFSKWPSMGWWGLWVQHMLWVQQSTMVHQDLTHHNQWQHRTEDLYSSSYWYRKYTYRTHWTVRPMKKKHLEEIFTWPVHLSYCPLYILHVPVRLVSYTDLRAY